MRSPDEWLLNFWMWLDECDFVYLIALQPVWHLSPTAERSCNLHRPCTRNKVLEDWTEQFFLNFEFSSSSVCYACSTADAIVGCHSKYIPLTALCVPGIAAQTWTDKHRAPTRSLLPWTEPFCICLIADLFLKMMRWIKSLRWSIGEGLLLWIMLRPLCKPCSSVCTVRCRHGWVLLCTTAGPEGTVSDPEGTESVGNIPTLSLSVQQTSFHHSEMRNWSYVQQWKYFGKTCFMCKSFPAKSNNFVAERLWRLMKVFMSFEGMCWTARTNWSNHRLASK